MCVGRHMDRSVRGVEMQLLGDLMGGNCRFRQEIVSLNNQQRRKVFLFLIISRTISFPSCHSTRLDEEAAEAAVADGRDETDNFTPVQCS